MNGPLKMYSVKAIIRHDVPIELPGCMYKMKNILSRDNDHSEHVLSPARNLDICEQVKKFLKEHQMHPDMAALQARQQKILEQLSELKEQILSLKGTLKVAAPPAVTCRPKMTTSTLNTQEIQKLSDVVMNVNPANPPYALLQLQKLWSEVLQLEIHIYTHSSVQALSEEAKAFVRNIQNATCSTVPKLVVRLIWKEVDGNIELITSCGATTILGEPNVVRFFSRIGPDNFNYELSENPGDIDSVLDVCYLLSRARTKTERHTYLQTLNGKLGKSQWLCNRRDISIADIVACSIIKQVTTNGEVNVNLTKWLQRCENV